MIRPSPYRRVSQPPTTAPIGKATRKRRRTSAAASWPPLCVVRAKTGTSTSAAIRAAPTRKLTSNEPHAGLAPSRPGGMIAWAVRRCHSAKAIAKTTAPTSNHGPAGVITSRSGSAVANASTTPASATASRSAPNQVNLRHQVRKARPALVEDQCQPQDQQHERDHADGSQQPGLAAEGHERQTERDAVR